MRYSYSNVSTFASCPYKWWLNYKERLKTIPETNADNALYLGLALHKGIEDWDVQSGIDEYTSHYYVLNDANYNYIMQLEYQIPKVLEVLPSGGQHEITIQTDEFIGFVDYVVGDTIYDFKFSNNVEKYLESPQLSIYKYYLEQTHPDIKINHLKFVFVPKVAIRQKKTESIYEFRNRLEAALEETEVQIVEVDYDESSVTQFKDCCNRLETVTKEQCIKNVTKLCDWCQFKDYCISDGVVNWNIIVDEE